MSVLKKLTEGIVGRSLQREGAALLEKWEATGLLEGIENDSKRQGMARLLENQAAQLLKEASSMAAGDVEGFASVAFPIVRRVFGGLLANDLVSVQPMSLPSGLIFFMDFTYEDSRLGLLGGATAQSIYGGGVTGSQITGGVSDIRETGGGFYNLANAYSHATGSVQGLSGTDADDATNGGGLIVVASGVQVASKLVSALTEAEKAFVKWDPDLLANPTWAVNVIDCAWSADHATDAPGRPLTGLNTDMVQAIYLGTGTNILAIDNGTAVGTLPANTRAERRLTQVVNPTTIRFVLVNTEGTAIAHSGGGTPALADGDGLGVVGYPYSDQFTGGDGLGSVVGTANWPLEEPKTGTGNFGDDGGKQEIAEIDIRVESIAVTAQTKKLKAKWSPELGQDLNAYHNLDAEVELTQILSEQIALELDREILNDLVQGAKASTYYWSRSPGLFVNRTTGLELGATAAAPDFTGTVSEWYETLVETINDVSAQIHRKTLRGGANFLVTSPEVANILEFTSGFRASVTHDTDRGTVGAVNVGSMSRKWDVYVDPYFPRNLVLVGRKGGSFLESGYVYAPYVPLQVTPTIFGTEDFVPRKGVMTRYAKKMVRPDMYGLVVVRGLLGESGS